MSIITILISGDMPINFQVNSASTFISLRWRTHKNWMPNIATFKKQTFGI